MVSKSSLSQNTTWLYASLFIYFFLILGLITALIFNFLYINGPPEERCPNINECVECSPSPCTTLTELSGCHASNETISTLGNPNTAFEFYLLGSVGNTSDTVSIGSFGQAFSTLVTFVEDVSGISMPLYRTTNILSSNVGKFSYIPATNSITETKFGNVLTTQTVALTGTFFPIIFEKDNTSTTDTETNTVEYVGGNVRVTGNISTTVRWLYLASDTELGFTNLDEGLYPVLTTVAPVGTVDDNYNRYVWTYYQI